MHRPTIVTLLLLLPVWTAEAVPPATVDFREIVNTATLIPSGSGRFQELGFPSLDDEGTIAFRGEGPFRQVGVYTAVGNSLAMIAERDTPVPGDGGLFTGFSSPRASRGAVAFGGDGRLGLRWGGVYSNLLGPLEVVADVNTPIPDSSRTFRRFSSVSIDGVSVAFHASGTGRSGIYGRFGGAIETVVDNLTPLPGGQGFFSTSLTLWQLRNGKVLFSHRAEPRGVFLADRDVVSVVADLDTPIPGGFGAFTGFSSSAFDGENVAFKGFGLDQEGVYASSGGELRRVADGFSSAPGVAFFSRFGNVSVDGQLVAFSASFVSPDGRFLSGLFVGFHGRLYRVVDLSQRIGPRVLTALAISQDALRGNELAFRMEFGGNASQAIFVATITGLVEPAVVDVFPGGSKPVSSLSRRTIPVAVLGADGFDVADIDAATLRFGPGQAEPQGAVEFRDVNGDGFLDLLGSYRVDEAGLAFGLAEACLSGQRFDASVFEGCDEIDTLPACEPDPRSAR